MPKLSARRTSRPRRKSVIDTRAATVAPAISTPGSKARRNRANTSQWVARSVPPVNPSASSTASSNQSGRRRSPSSVRRIAPTRLGFCFRPNLDHSWCKRKDSVPRAPFTSVRNVRSTSGGNPSACAASPSRQAATRCRRYRRSSSTRTSSDRRSASIRTSASANVSAGSSSATRSIKGPPGAGTPSRAPRRKRRRVFAKPCDRSARTTIQSSS